MNNTNTLPAPGITDEQIRAAIDAAFDGATPLRVLTAIYGAPGWHPESEDRLNIAKSFLARLAQPEPTSGPTPPEGFHLATEEERAKMPKGSQYWDPARRQWLLSTRWGNVAVTARVYACPNAPEPAPTGQHGAAGMQQEQPGESLGQVLYEAIKTTQGYPPPICIPWKTLTGSVRKELEEHAQAVATHATAQLRAEVERLNLVIEDAIVQLNLDGTTPANLGAQINKKIMQRDGWHQQTIARAEAAEAKVKELEQSLYETQGKAKCAEAELRNIGVVAKWHGWHEKHPSDLETFLRIHMQTLKEDAEDKAELVTQSLARKARVAELERQLAGMTTQRDEAVQLCLNAQKAPTLLPIASAPAEVPEGFVRVYVCIRGVIQWASASKNWADTHFCDIRLPAESQPVSPPATFSKEAKLSQPRKTRTPTSRR